MKLLLFSDLHCDRKAAQKLVEMTAAHHIDILVGAGDFGSLRRRVGDVIDVLRTADKPAVFVPGNAESAEELQAVCAGWPAAHVLHGNGVTVAGVSFFGVGGGIPITPFGAWSYDFSDEDATQMFDPCTACDVIVTHSPPKNAVDRSSRGVHLGSTAIRSAIERVRPQLAVCGHIHDSWEARDMIGETVVINAGPRGLIFEL